MSESKQEHTQEAFEKNEADCQETCEKRKEHAQNAFETNKESTQDTLDKEQEPTQENKTEGRKERKYKGKDPTWISSKRAWDSLDILGVWEDNKRNNYIVELHNGALVCARRGP